MPQLCTLGEWPRVQTTDGGPSAGGSVGPGNPGNGCIVSLRLKMCCPLHTLSRDQTNCHFSRARRQVLLWRSWQTYLCQLRSIPGKSQRRSHSLQGQEGSPLHSTDSTSLSARCIP